MAKVTEFSVAFIAMQMSTLASSRARCVLLLANRSFNEKQKTYEIRASASGI
jgi:hypothetical protein